MSDGIHPRQILIVDDDDQVREVLHHIFLAASYDCLLATNGQEGVQVFRNHRPPLILTDLKMPVMDGIGLLEAVRKDDPDVSVIVLTGAPDVKTAIDSLRLGAYDFIMKPVNVDELLFAVTRALERRQLLIERREHQAVLERRVEEATRDLHSAYRATLEVLGSALASRDIGTEAHSRRVHGYAMATAREYGMPAADMPDLERGVLLHDIGKIGIPDSILLKAGPLTSEEWQIMRRHPEIGRRLVQGVPFLHRAIPIVYCHHEKWNGTGYPQGLEGEQIPIGARIFSIVDAFDAMTFDRPYSKAIPFHAAYAEIRSQSGIHFDPKVVEAFLRVPQSLLEEIRRKSDEA